MKATILYFSPCGSTRARAEEIGLQLEKFASVSIFDIHKINDKRMRFEGDLLVVATPIYNNALPKYACEQLNLCELHFKSAAICLVYGGVTKGNAMAECVRILECKNIDFAGGGFLCARHCYIDKKIGNCNDKDRFAIEKLIDHTLKNIADGKTLKTHKNFLPAVLSKTMDKHRGSWFPKPYTDKNKCSSCGKCLGLCPVEAIDSSYFTDDRCIHCNACVNFCAENARISNIDQRVKFGIKFARLFHKKYKIL